jgi:hypothetical protein
MMETRLKRKRQTSISETSSDGKKRKRPSFSPHSMETRFRHRQPKVTLLSLPYDVRCIIYELLLEPAADLETNLSKGTPTSSHLRFLPTCRTIYEEARVQAFRRATFIIDFRNREERLSLLPTRFDRRDRTHPPAELRLRRRWMRGPATGWPSPLERLCDAVLSLRPEHRGAVRSAALILADCPPRWPGPQVAPQAWQVDQSRALHAAVSLLPSLQRLAVPVTPNNPGGPWFRHFYPFEHCYGAVLAPPRPPPWPQFRFGLLPMVRTPPEAVRPLDPPTRLPPRWASFRDTILERSVASAVAPLRKYVRQHSTNNKVVPHAISVAIVQDGRDPRDYCWTRIVPDIKADACRAGREPQTWLAEDSDGRPISMCHDLARTSFACHSFTKGALQPGPWRFVEQGSGRSIELRMGWTDALQCPYTKKIFASPYAGAAST